MVNKLPLARKETERWTVLLGRESDRKTESKSSSRDKRKKSSSTSRGNPSSSAKDTPRQSESSSKVKRANAGSSRPKGHRRDNKNRKQNRRAEGEDTELRRTASELGVTFPCSFCSDSKSHYWIGIDSICGGVIFRCRYCHRHKWLPIDYLDAIDIGKAIAKSGTEGYCKYLDKPKNRAAKILIAKLQELDRLSTTITDAEEMAKIAVKILNQKKYDEVEEGK